jgi:hypothetical protein
MFKNTIIVCHCRLCLNPISVSTKLIVSMFVKRTKSNKCDRIVSWTASGAGDKDVHGVRRQGSNFPPDCKYESKEGLQGLKLIRFSSRVTALSNENHYNTRTAPPPLITRTSSSPVELPC